MKTLKIAVMLLTVACSVGVEASPVYSWNLSRDMMRSEFTTTPSSSFGVGNVWTAMYDAVGISHNENYYQSLPLYTPNLTGYPIAAWMKPEVSTGVVTKTFIFNGVTRQQGTSYTHPSPALSSVIRWKSPINGVVNITGSVADVDPTCGNGINWFVDKDNFTLMQGTLLNGNNGAVILQQNIPVSAGMDLYFIVSSKDNNHVCDSTHWDIIITGQ